MRLLLIEDNDRIVRFLRQGLEEEGFAVDVATDGRDGLRRLLEETPDLCVLDVMLPAIDGFEVLHRARAAGNRTPILLLTARADVRDRVRGLDLGGDDYLTKPFAFEELLARLRALGRRAGEHEPAQQRYADVEVCLRKHTARRGERCLNLSPREFALLRLFVSNPGRDLPRDEILREAFQCDFDPGTNLVDVYVGYLRRKLGDPPLIRTVRGVGYRMEFRG